MGRLIDADKLKVYLQEYLHYGHAIHWVDAQPTAYDVEKVVAKMERKKQTSIECLGERNGTGFNKVMDVAIDIVRKGGVNEYNI